MESKKVRDYIFKYATLEVYLMNIMTNTTGYNQTMSQKQLKSIYGSYFVYKVEDIDIDKTTKVYIGRIKVEIDKKNKNLSFNLEKYGSKRSN